MDDKTLSTLQLDYQQTVYQISILTDIRFKLLAFVPTLAGAAIVFLSEASVPETALAVGLLGFVVTVGIIFYDLRNTQLYDASIHRAKALEKRLDFPIVTKGKLEGGLYNERPDRSLKLFEIDELKIWHKRGLAVVYSAALGAWLYMIANAGLTLIGSTNSLIALAVAIVFAVLCLREYERLSRPKDLEPYESMQVDAAS